jgi:microsomal dipeptidase-like Zn-dependent dipeptidase
MINAKTAFAMSQAAVTEQLAESTDEILAEIEKSISRDANHGETELVFCIEGEWPFGNKSDLYITKVAGLLRDQGYRVCVLRSCSMMTIKWGEA